MEQNCHSLLLFGAAFVCGCVLNRLLCSIPIGELNFLSLGICETSIEVNRCDGTSSCVLDHNQSWLWQLHVTWFMYRVKSFEVKKFSSNFSWKKRKRKIKRNFIVLYSSFIPVVTVVSSATTQLFLSITRKLDDFTFPQLNCDALTQVNENARFRQF